MLRISENNKIIWTHQLCSLEANLQYITRQAKILGVSDTPFWDCLNFSYRPHPRRLRHWHCCMVVCDVHRLTRFLSVRLCLSLRLRNDQAAYGLTGQILLTQQLLARYQPTPPSVSNLLWFNKYLQLTYLLSVTCCCDNDHAVSKVK